MRSQRLTGNVSISFYLRIKISSLNKATVLIDLNLIEECRGGNLNNFRKLVELTSPMAFAVAFRMLGDEDEAKDVVQETMITIWQKLNKIRSAGVYKTWIYRIVMNKCYDILRMRKNNQEFTTDDKTWAFLSETLSEGFTQTLENEEIARIIKFLTDLLSPKQKAIFILSEIEQLTGDEISAITGMGKQGIKANLYYARKNISMMLEKYL